MIWKTRTHEYSATVCQKTGQPCPSLARLARTIAQSMDNARPVTSDAFQIDGHSALSYCPEGCTARFRARPDNIRVYCGADPEANTETLDDYANMMFRSDPLTLPSDCISSPPCAMIEVLALKSTLAGAISEQVCA